MIAAIDFSVLTQPVFTVVATGAAVLAITSGAIGCLSVLKGQSLIGDAMGHAAFPGVVLAFILFQSRDPLLLMMGAAFTGFIGFAFIQIAKDATKIPLDAGMGITLSSLFGLGIVLKSYISGNPDFSNASQAGLQSYIFGQASYILQRDVTLIWIVSIISLALLLIFFKELKVHLFDPVLAEVMGYKRWTMNVVILLTTLMLIATGLKMVGAILISSMLIAPAVTALQWTNRYSLALLIAAAVGGVSAVIGVALATLGNGLATGPSIVVVMSLFALISLVIAPRGIIAAERNRKLAEAKSAEKEAHDLEAQAAEKVGA